jgi:hypothetical protein
MSMPPGPLDSAKALIDAARDRKLQAERSLQMLEVQANELRLQIAEWDTFIKKAESMIGEEQKAGKTELPTPPIKVKRGSLAAAAAEALASAGDLTLDDLAIELGARGHGKDAADFRTVLNTMLWRKKGLFQKDEAGYYKLKTDRYEVAD